MPREHERIHFLDEQRRNRRRSRRFSVFAVVAVAIAGIPLCVVISPFLFGVVLVGAHVWDLASPLSPERWDALHDVAFALPGIWSRIRGDAGHLPWGPLALLLVVPGAILVLVAWPFVRLLGRYAGAGTILRRLPARDPNPAVLAEQQLANVVQEVAVAAGVRTPTVRIIESEAVNAVAIGLTTDDAHLLASSGFLQRLDRDERQALVAHLVGSVGNGDLEIASVILSVFQTWGLTALLLEAPVDARRRALVRRFIAASGAAARGRVDREEARALLDTFLGGAADEHEEFIANVYSITPRSVAGALYIMFVQIPLIATIGLASIAAKATTALLTSLVFGPWVSAMWRARRRLADATAVQLTRNPGALASAVRKLDQSDVVIPGGWAVNFLFPVWTPITEENAGQTEIAAHIVGMRLETKPRLERLSALGANLDAASISRDAPLRARLREMLPEWNDLRTALLWGALATVLCVALLLVSLVAASALLSAFWIVLQWITAVPRWVRRQF